MPFPQEQVHGLFSQVSMASFLRCSQVFSGEHGLFSQVSLSAWDMTACMCVCVCVCVCVRGGGGLSNAVSTV